MIVYNEIPIEADEQIIDSYDGTKTLTASGAVDSALNQLKQEERILCDGNAWIVKSVEQLDNELTITAEIDMDDWHTRVYTSYRSEEALLSTVLDEIKPPGWTIENASLVSVRRTIELQDVDDYGVLMQTQDTYACVFAFDCMNKVLTVIKPDTIEWSGAYITEQVNLRRSDYKGETAEFCTRLYPYGAVDEETGESLNIKSVNDGIEYVENRTYADKIIAKIWRDERYTDPQSLKDAAIERLAKIASPVESYELDVIDLAKMNPEYQLLNVSLYDKVMLMDSVRNTRRIFEVVQKTRYPAAPEMNVITLSTESVTLSAQIEQAVIGQVDEELIRQQGKINEIRRDVDTNTARIAETYTKGETDVLLESNVLQSKEEILAQVSETYATSEQVDDLEDADTQIRQGLAALSVTVDGVAAQTQHRGGANLLHGTAAFSLEDFVTEGTVSLSRDSTYAADVRNYSAAGGGFVLEGAASLSQTADTIPGGQYCFMLRYKLLGSGAAAGMVIAGGTEMELLPVPEWTQVKGNLIASGTAVDFAVECTSGTLIVADLILMPGLEVSDWQQAQNEILTEQMTFSGGVLSIGASGEKLSTRIDNASFAVKNNASGKYEAFFDENGAQFGKTSVRGTLTIEPASKQKGLVLSSVGDGHNLFTVND